jgi:Tol biopolymer transport system component
MTNPFYGSCKQHTFSSVLILATASTFLVACSEDTPKEPSVPIASAKVIHHADPFWSSDGLMVYYYDYGITKVTNGSFEIDKHKVGLWRVSLTDGSRRQIMKGGGRSGSISPDGEWLVYEHDAKIYTVKFVNGDIDSTTLLLLASQGTNHFPAWNGDGTWIAFDSNYEDPRRAQVIWKIKPDGSGLTDISEHGVGEWRMPDWHPTTSSIVHIRYPGGGTFSSEIYTMDSEGLSPVRLTHNNETDLSPKFSPDGELICFFSGSTTDAAIWLMNSDGSNKNRLVAGREPSWAPDGTRIAFVGLFHDASEYGYIWAVDLDGNNLVQITFPDLLNRWQGDEQ